MFVRWCLQRETVRLWNYLVLITPVLVAGYFSRFSLDERVSSPGPHLLQNLLWISVFFVFVAGVRHASKAVCWEVSREQRDLVRLTGIDPRTLLWCKVFSHWCTICLSILMILPLALFARTLGAVEFDQWFAGGCWLLLITLLTAGFAMIASVTSNQVANPETTASTATFLLMIVYHLMFWGGAAVIGLISWLTSGAVDLGVGSSGQKAIHSILSLAPMAGLFRGLSSPSTFSPWNVTYWFHFVTAGFFMWAATKVIRGRFRVTTRGDEEPTQQKSIIKSVSELPYLRPRCGHRPFFWKDRYILGGGKWSQSWWTAISLLATAAVISAVVYGVPATLIAVLSVCAAPCLLATRFDALLVPEFRDQTWGSLMLLPVDPGLIMLEKIRAAAWEQMALLLPVGVSIAMGMVSSPNVVLMVVPLAFLSGVLLIEISIIKQLYIKTWWINLVVLNITLGLIIGVVTVWLTCPAVTSFVSTVAALVIVIFGFMFQIRKRLENWSEQ